MSKKQSKKLTWKKIRKMARGSEAPIAAGVATVIGAIATVAMSDEVQSHARSLFNSVRDQLRRAKGADDGERSSSGGRGERSETGAERDEEAVASVNDADIPAPAH